MKKTINKGLGKGLGALLAQDIQEYDENSIIYINCNEIISNPHQPRKNFDTQSLQELSDNIKQFGILQPILVIKDNDKYQLIAGERRLRASQIAGIEKIPAIVKELNNKDQTFIAIIENIQRQELNAIEEAYAYEKLSQEYNFTHEEIALKVGKSRSHISNLLRLMNLSKPVQEMLLESKIEMGHARAIVTQEKSAQLNLANKIIKDNMSVRDIENYLKAKPKLEKVKNINKDIEYIQEELIEILGLNINIKSKNNKKGSIEIHYNSLDEFDSIIQQLKK